MESRMKAIEARKKGLLDFNKPLKFMAERGDSNSRYLLSTHDFQSCFTELNITRLLRHNGLTLEYIAYYFTILH